MMLIPMDENTLAFLKDLVDLYREAQSDGDVNEFNSAVMYSAFCFFSAPDNKTGTLNAFMEAIKNADSNN